MSLIILETVEEIISDLKIFQQKTPKQKSEGQKTEKKFQNIQGCGAIEDVTYRLWEFQKEKKETKEQKKYF